jgi:hypothetical protein
MVLDHVDESTAESEYVIQNTDFGNGGPVLRIPKTRPYYAYGDVMYMNQHGPGEYYYRQNGMSMRFANERFEDTMQPKTWYLLPHAYSIVLTHDEHVSSSSDSSSEEELSENELVYSDESDDTSSEEESKPFPFQFKRQAVIGIK